MKRLSKKSKTWLTISAILGVSATAIAIPVVNACRPSIPAWMNQASANTQSCTQNNLQYLLNTKTYTASVMGQTKSQSTLNIPAYINYNGQLFTVNSVGPNAFCNQHLTNVIFPATIVNIGAYSFANNDLSTLSLPSSLTSLGNYAFINNPFNVNTTIVLPTTCVWNKQFNASAFSTNDNLNDQFKGVSSIIQGESVYQYVPNKHAWSIVSYTPSISNLDDLTKANIHVASFDQIFNGAGVANSDKVQPSMAAQGNNAVQSLANNIVNYRQTMVNANTLTSPQWLSDGLNNTSILLGQNAYFYFDTTNHTIVPAVANTSDGQSVDQIYNNYLSDITVNNMGVNFEILTPNKNNNATYNYEIDTADMFSPFNSDANSTSSTVMNYQIGDILGVQTTNQDYNVYGGDENQRPPFIVGTSANPSNNNTIYNNYHVAYNLSDSTSQQTGGFTYFKITKSGLVPYQFAFSTKGWYVSQDAPSDGVSVSGTGIPNSQIDINFANGTNTSVNVNSDGNWTCHLSQDAANNLTLNSTITFNYVVSSLPPNSIVPPQFSTHVLMYSAGEMGLAFTTNKWESTSNSALPFTLLFNDPNNQGHMGIFFNEEFPEGLNPNNNPAYQWKYGTANSNQSIHGNVNDINDSIYLKITVTFNGRTYSNEVAIVGSASSIQSQIAQLPFFNNEIVNVQVVNDFSGQSYAWCVGAVSYNKIIANPLVPETPIYNTNSQGGTTQVGTIVNNMTFSVSNEKGIVPIKGMSNSMVANDSGTVLNTWFATNHMLINSTGASYVDGLYKNWYNPTAKMFQLINLLTDNNAYSDTQKIYNISQWVSNNMTYTLSYSYGYSLAWTFNHLEGVCGQFAMLTAALLSMAGVPSEIVAGMPDTKPFTYGTYSEQSHAWVKAWDEQKGMWITVDPTWHWISPMTMLQPIFNYDRAFQTIAAVFWPVGTTYLSNFKGHLDQAYKNLGITTNTYNNRMDSNLSPYTTSTLAQALTIASNLNNNQALQISMPLTYWNLKD